MALYRASLLRLFVGVLLLILQTVRIWTKNTCVSQKNANKI